MTVHALITNDDGVDSPGLAALARAAQRCGMTVTIAAPATEASGTGAGLHSVAGYGRVEVERRVTPGLDDVETFAVSAHPGMIAFVACRGAFGPVPDLVLSGVNRGPNVGRSILHSGTVGAALTAQVAGVSALAVSLDFWKADEVHWDTATDATAALLPVLSEMPRGSVLNLNVPNSTVVKSLVWAELASFGAIQSRVDSLRDGVISVGVVTVADEPEPGTDAAYLAAGHATVTALSSVARDATVEPALPAWPG